MGGGSLENLGAAVGAARVRRRLADSCGSGSSRSSGSWWSGSDGGSADAAAEDDAKLLTALADWAEAESGSNAQLMVRGSASTIHVAMTICHPVCARAVAQHRTATRHQRCC